MQHFKIITLTTTILCSISAHAQTLDLPQDSYFDFSQQEPEDILDIEYDTQEKDYSILSNQLYQTERFRIFNYMAYDSEQLSAQAKSGNLDNISQLSVSFGYGIEYRVNNRNKVGYEFLSSFPYDRGQMIRLFWVRVL